MLKNYFKIAFRNILLNKVYSFINIAGLAVGIAVSILIFLFVKNELSFDKFNVNGDRIYRVITKKERNGETIAQSAQPLPLGPELVSEFPEIESAVRFFSGEAIISYNGNHYKEDVKFTDPEVLSVFSFPLLEGNSSSALAQPNSVVLTEKVAREIFGNEDPISKLIEVNLGERTETYVVTGKAKDIPDNSSIDFNILLPVSKMPEYQKEMNDWSSFSGSTFILLSKSFEIINVERNISNFVKKYFGSFISEGQASGWIDRSDNAFELRFQPLSDIHFSNVKYGMEREGNPVYSYLLSIIAFIILFIASVNFVTLSLGRSASRAKEVGVRKVLGAGRNNIMKQFWSESILLTAVAFLISLFLVELLLPLFNQLSGKHFKMLNVISPDFLVVLGALIIFVGMLAGSYPSVILSKFQPVEVLKGKLRIGKGSIFSKSLVVIQFGLAVFLIICSVTIWSQLKYIQTKDLGYNGDQVIVIPVNWWGQGNGARVIDLFKSKLSGYPGVIDISGTSATFGEGWGMKLFKYDGIVHQTYVYRVDEDYIPTLGLKLLEGRNFIKGSGADSVQSAIVNEEFVKDLGWKLPAVGKRLMDWDKKNLPQGLEIIGVVKDYNFMSLHDKIGPVILAKDPSWSMSVMMIKINKANIPAAMSHLKKVYSEILPDTPFEFTFVNQNVQKQYDDEMEWGEIVSTGSILAILISCLGLFGLVTLAVSSRTKEVGIRKVLGASINNIITVISKDFIKLVAISNLIALPIAYYAGHKWLQDFAYRIEMSPWIFLLAAGVTFAISLLTIAFHAIKAATANPVEALRYE